MAIPWMTIQYFLALVSGIYIIFFSIGASQKNANWIIKFDETQDAHTIMAKAHSKMYQVGGDGLGSPDLQYSEAERGNIKASGLFADNPEFIDRDFDGVPDLHDLFPLWSFADSLDTSGKPFLRGNPSDTCNCQSSRQNSGIDPACSRAPGGARIWTEEFCKHDYTTEPHIKAVTWDGEVTPPNQHRPLETYMFSMQKIASSGEPYPSTEYSYTGQVFGIEACNNVFANLDASSARSTCVMNFTAAESDLESALRGDINVDPNCLILLCCDGSFGPSVCTDAKGQLSEGVKSSIHTKLPVADVTYETHVTLGLTHACSDVYGSDKAGTIPHATTQNHCMKTTDLLEHHNEDNSTVFHTWYALHWTVLALASVHIVIVIVLMFIPEKFGFDSERFQMFHAIIPVLVFAVTLTTTIYFFLLHDGDDDLAEPARTDGANFTLPGRHGVYEHFDFELNKPNKPVEIADNYVMIDVSQSVPKNAEDRYTGWGIALAIAYILQILSTIFYMAQVPAYRNFLRMNQQTTGSQVSAPVGGDATAQPPRSIYASASKLAF